VDSPEPAKILKFNVPFLCEPESECQSEGSPVGQNNRKSSQAPPSPEDATVKDPDVTTSSVGLFIIIGLLVFSLILCIVFCAVRKRKNPDSKSRAAPDGKGAFAAVSSKDTGPPPASV